MAKRNGIHPILTILAVAALLGILAYALFSGRKQRDILGTWVTDTCKVESGFQCGTMGIAATINNATYQYNNWELSHGNLILSGKQFKDRRVYEFSDTLKIKRLTSKSLVVEQNGKTTNYKKIR